MMGNYTRSDSITSGGNAETAGSVIRDAQLLENLRILWMSYSKPSDGYRHDLLARTIHELECCYATIEAMDVLIEELEKGNEQRT